MRRAPQRPQYRCASLWWKPHSGQYTTPVSVGVVGLEIALQALQVRQPAGQDGAQRVDVDHRDLTLVASLQPVDQLALEQLDPPVQEPATVGDLPLLLRELLDQRLEVGVREGGELGREV